MSAVSAEALRPLQREKRASTLALTGEMPLSNVSYQMMIDCVNDLKFYLIIIIS